MSLQICANLRQQFRAHSLSDPQGRIEDVIQLSGLLWHGWKTLLNEGGLAKRPATDSLPPPSRKKRAGNLSEAEEGTYSCMAGVECKDRKFSEKGLQMHL